MSVVLAERVALKYRSVSAKMRVDISAESVDRLRPLLHMIQLF